VSGNEPVPKASFEFRRQAVRILQTLIIVYVLVVLAAVIFQRRLIYFPRTIPSGLAERAAAENGFVPWRNKAGQIIGWKLPARSLPTGSVLIVHGNAGCAIDREYLAGPIHDAAMVDVYVLEYPGYGARGGSPNKQSLIGAGEEAFELLPKYFPRYVVSESIGAGVACHLAKAHSVEVAGLLLFMPYHNLASVAQRKMFFLPAYLFLLDRFNPAKDLKDYRGPVKIVLAGADEIIPAASGLRLFEKYEGTKTLQIIPGAHHNEVAGQSTDWWKGVFSFWQQNSQTPFHRSGNR
jgi:pimeloyl-ACP methyl ester carboxylesterase